MTTTHPTRRRVLAGGAGLFAAGLAGCTDSLSADGGEGATAQASIFVLQDFARAVAGDAMNVENLVPVGQHGHGWEPSPTVQRDVLESEAFVYAMPGFQPWADDVIRNVESENADVTIIEAGHGVDLLPAPGHDEHDHDGNDHGGEGGNGNGSEGDRSEHGGSDGHDHGNVDPHFWLDPERAKRAVENVRAGLAETDGGNADAFERNASKFAGRLDELDSTFESRLGGTDRNVVLVAGHNSFQYLARRYGFEVHALSGLAPDATPSPRDVSRAQDVIDEHGIEYVLAPVFESNEAAKRLVAETDAKGVKEITPIPSTTEEWNRNGWGYIDIMTEVNLPSLAAALGGR